MSSPFRLPMFLTLSLSGLFALGCGAFSPKDDDDDDDEDEWWGDDSGIDGEDTEGETDDEETADSPPPEEGTAITHWTGTWEVSRGSFVAGELGFYYVGMDTEETLCTNLLEFEEVGTPSVDCPDCVWAFDLEAAEQTTTGAVCDDLGIDDEILLDEGWGELGWGFSPTMVYESGGYDFDLENVLWVYANSDWYLFAYNYNGSEMVTASGNFVNFDAYVARDDESVYYYYPL